MNFLFSRHTRRRASPRPADDRGSDDVNITSPTNRRRRRQLNDMGGVSLLPLTYQLSGGVSNSSSSKSITKQRSSSKLLATKSTATASTTTAAGRHHYGAAGNLPIMTPGSSTCNSFLMGGHYYPGKDKKRRQYFERRKNSCMQRVFCSSIWRMIGSTVVVAYMIVWHVILPVTDIVLDYGRLWSGPSPSQERHEIRLHRSRRRGRRKPLEDIHGTIQWLVHDASLHLLSPPQRREEMEKLKAERERLQYNNPELRYQRRRSIWEEIVPDWVHRNDINALEGSEREEETKQEGDEQKDRIGDGATEPLLVQQLEVNNQQVNQDGASKHREAINDLAEPNQTDNFKKEDESERRRIEEAHQLPPSSSSSIRRRLRTLENMHEFANQTNCPATLSSDDISTTLVIQSSLERMWILELTCQRWKDPIVVVLWLPPNDSGAVWSPPVPCPQMKLIQYKASSKEDIRSYPVNQLRNLGLDAVETSHVLVMDVDFVPSQLLHQEIQSVLIERRHQQMITNSVEKNEREAVVIPAFERLLPSPCNTVDDCRSYLQQDPLFLPRTFSELQGCVASENCSVFQSQINWEGHYSTRSEAWLAGDWYENDVNETLVGAVKSIKTIHCFDTLRYEPYVVLRWCPTKDPDSDLKSLTLERKLIPPVAPFYDERFYGYGKNKIEMISHLRFMGYRFAILPRGFLIHHPHPESVAKETWKGDHHLVVGATTKKMDLHQEMDRLYTEFLTELMAIYQHQMKDMVQPCNLQ